MKPKITFISASAGSGKTYRVVEEIHRRLTDGNCRPGGLIATTFTVKAAAELKDRLRQKLYGTGHSILAERLNEATIGTVHSVCRQLLERFRVRRRHFTQDGNHHRGPGGGIAGPGNRIRNLGGFH